MDPITVVLALAWLTVLASRAAEPLRAMKPPKEYMPSVAFPLPYLLAPALGERLGERASGAYTVTLQDGIGRQSGVGFGVIRDTTPPTLTLAALVQGEVHVTWNVEDSGSGVDASTCLLEVREDEGTWQTFSTECGGDDTHDGQPGHTYTFPSTPLRTKPPGRQRQRLR